MIPHVDKDMKYGIIHKDFKRQKNMWSEKAKENIRRIYVVN